jgi:hypothetical protein
MGPDVWRAQFSVLSDHMQGESRGPDQAAACRIGGSFQPLVKPAGLWFNLPKANTNTGTFLVPVTGELIYKHRSHATRTNRTLQGGR